MSTKRIARILEVVTSPVDGKQFVCAVGGTFESISLDGRWSYNTVWSKVTDAINTRIKSGILKQNVGYAIYNYGGGLGLNLESVHIQAEFKELPTRWL